MAQYDELTGLLRELLTNKFSPKPRYINGLLGDGLGNVVVPDRPDKVYARFSKESTTYFEIFNVTVPKVNNWPVKIGELPWNPGLTQVVGTNWSAFEQAGWGDVLGSTSPHAPTHEWPDGAPGSDVVSVFTRAIVPGRAFVTPGAPTTIYVNSFEYGTTGTLWPGLPGVDLQPVMSATVTGTMRYAGVYVNEDTNSLGVVTGGTTVYTSALEPPRVSFPATGVIPIARVRVYGGQAGLVEADIKDARRLWGTGGGEGGVVGAWPADGKAMINATEYATITLALAAASSGDTVKVGPGTFTENITIPAGVIVVGTSVYGTIISGSVTFGGANGSIERCRITRAGDCVTSAQAGVNTVVGCQILPTATFATGVKADGSGVTVVVMYTFIGGGGVSINSLYALNSGAVRAFHCRLDNDLRGLTSGVVYVTNCELTNGSITGDVRGILDLSTGSMALPYDGFITMDELASAPTTPITNSWSLYFKNDGLYHVDDAGTETGPLGTGGGGYPFTTLTVDAADANADQATIQAGVDAATDELIEVGPGSYNEAPDIDEPVKVQGISRDRVIVQQTVTLSETSIVEWIKDTASIGFTVESTGSGSLLRECEAQHSADTVNNIGYYNQAAVLTLENCRANISGSTTANWAIVNTSNGATITIRGGEFSASGTGALAFYALQPATLNLYGPRFNGPVDFTGCTISASSWWYDAAGDVHLAGDAAGVKQRAINIYQSATDHFDAGSLSGWTWASYSGFVTPANINLTNFPSMLQLWHSSTAIRAFAYRSSHGSDQYCRLSPTFEVRTGIRQDDGTNNNYLEYWLELNANIKYNLVYRYAVGGSVTGPTTIVSDMQAGALYVLRLIRSGGGLLSMYFSLDLPLPIFTGVTVSALSAVTMTRSGIYHEHTGAGTPTQGRASFFDWYSQ